MKMIVAVNHVGTIGLENKLPWHCKEDLAYFKAVTMGHTIVMGRKTFESILSYANKPLVGRKHIVLTRDQSFTYEHEDVVIVHDVDLAFELAGEDAYLIGGASLYHECLDKVSEILLTRIDNEIIGDAFFPELPSHEWICHLIKEEEGATFYQYTRTSK